MDASPPFMFLDDSRAMCKKEGAGYFERVRFFDTRLNERK